MTECYYYYNIIWEIFSYLKYIRLYLKGLNSFFFTFCCTIKWNNNIFKFKEYEFLFWVVIIHATS